LLPPAGSGPPTTPARPRLGISVPRRVGGAVVRNRVRRRLREIFRRSRELFGHRGGNVVVNARPSASEATFVELAEEYRALRASAPETTVEKRLLLAALLSLGVLLLWEWIGPRPPKRAPLPVPTKGALAVPTPVAAREPSPVPGGVRIAGTQEGLTAVENDVARATFSNRGAVLTSFVLLKHADDPKRPLELVRPHPDPSPKPPGPAFPGKPDLQNP